MISTLLHYGPAFFWSVTAAATPAGSLILEGELKSPTVINETQFERLPHVEIKVKDVDGTLQTYSGVELAHILMMGRVPIRSNLKGKDIDKYVVAVGRDGFSAVISLPEFDSGRFIIADKLNGQSLPAAKGPLQLVSPDENRRARWVRQLSRIVIRKAAR